MKLLGYNYRVEHKQRRENRAADALSRVVNREQLGVISADVPVWITKILTSYDQDEYYKELITKLRVDPQAEPN